MNSFCKNDCFLGEVIILYMLPIIVSVFSVYFYSRRCFTFFLRDETKNFSSLNATGYLYVHQIYGTHFLYIKTQDPQNFFAIRYNLLRDSHNQNFYNLSQKTLKNISRSTSSTDEKYFFTELNNSLNHFNSSLYRPNNFLFFHYGNFDNNKVLKMVNDFINQLPKSSDEINIFKPSFNNTFPLTINAKKQSDIFDNSFLPLLLMKSFLFVNSSYHVNYESPFLIADVQTFDNTTKLKNELTQVLDTRFEQHMMQSYIQQYEMRNIDSNVGAQIWQIIIPHWVYGINPLAIFSEIKRVKDKLKKKPDYFKNLMKSKVINRHLLDKIFDPKSLSKIHELIVFFNIKLNRKLKHKNIVF